MNKEVVSSQSQLVFPETKYLLYNSLMMDTVTETISDIVNVSLVEDLKGFFDRLKFRSVSTFFAPLSIQQTVAELSSNSEVRSFVLSMYQRFMVALEVAEVTDSFRRVKARIVSFAAELHSDNCLLPDAVAFSEITKKDDLLKIVECNEWLVILYLCLSFGSFDDAMYEISQRPTE